MALTLDNFRAKKARLQALVDDGRTIMQLENPTLRQLSVSIGQVDRIAQSLKGYRTIKEVNNLPDFDFDVKTLQLFEDVDMLLIEMKALREELQTGSLGNQIGKEERASFLKSSKDTVSKTDEVQEVIRLFNDINLKDVLVQLRSIVSLQKEIDQFKVERGYQILGEAAC